MAALFLYQILEVSVFCSYFGLVGKRRYRRQEQSLVKRLQEHQKKIGAERAKGVPNEGLIRYWEREVKAFEVSITRARKRLRSE